MSIDLKHFSLYFGLQIDKEKKNKMERIMIMHTVIDQILLQKKKTPSYEKEYAEQYKEKKALEKVIENERIFNYVSEHTA